MTRNVNTLRVMYYTGPGPAWRGGERSVVVFWKGAANARLLDLGTLNTMTVKTDTLRHPYTRPWDGTAMRVMMKRLGIRAREMQRDGADLPLETIGAVISAARKAKYAMGDFR